jgi:hypothetical protein
VVTEVTGVTTQQEIPDMFFGSYSPTKYSRDVFLVTVVTRVTAPKKNSGEVFLVPVLVLS